MGKQRRGGGGKKEEQINALGGALLNMEDQSQQHQQQSPAAYAPGGNDAGTQSAGKGQQPCTHSRYLTPPYSSTPAASHRSTPRGMWP